MPPLEMSAVVRCGGGALVGARRRGRAHYESAIFVRADSRFHSLEDLRDASFAWVDRRSYSGFVAARAMLAEAFATDEPPIGQQHFHGSHRAVCEAVLRGWADAGATYATRDAAGAFVSAGWTDVLGDRAGEIRAVAVSPPIPCDGIAHRPGLPAAEQAGLRAVLSAMTDDDDGRDLLARIFNADSLGDPTDDLTAASQFLAAGRAAD
jgi:ABC-type phosphate/phosphonate transport system substrate-binding protein